MGWVWCRIAGSLVVEHCSSVDEQLGLELEQLELVGVGSCSWQLVLGHVELGRLSGHHLGNLGCSIFRHMIHHRIGLTCHRGRRSCVELELADIEVEQLEGLAVVVLVEQLANDLRWLGICRTRKIDKSFLKNLLNYAKAFTL